MRCNRPAIGSALSSTPTGCGSVSSAATPPAFHSISQARQLHAMAGFFVPCRGTPLSQPSHYPFPPRIPHPVRLIFNHQCRRPGAPRQGHPGCHDPHRAAGQADGRPDRDPAPMGQGPCPRSRQPCPGIDRATHHPAHQQRGELRGKALTQPRAATGSSSLSVAIEPYVDSIVRSPAAIS